jgi:hypothetical protein
MSQIQKWSMAEESVKQNPSGKWVKYADHQRCKQELLKMLREWSGTGIADCHCWNTDLRKRTDAALEEK